MFAKKLLEYKDALADEALSAELARGGHWVIAYVIPSMAWPVRVQKVGYKGQDYWIIPITKDAYPAVAVRARSGTPEGLGEKIARFLSVLSCVMGHGVLIESYGGGSHLIAHKRTSERGSIICNQLDLRYLPEVSDQKAMLALALMREGRGLRHPAYSFLSFWRVLEVAIGRKKIKAWVGDAIDRLDERGAREAIGKMMAGGITDLADHLYVSGRCAIAHASNDPIVNPDQPEDAQRLYQERPVVESLAVLAIEEKFGIKTSHTIYKEHRYELAGFKRILGDDLVVKIVNRDEIFEETVVNFPRSISVS